MNMELSRRQFMAGAGAGLAGTTLGALGFAESEAAHAAAIRPYKLAQTKEARTICPYCAVSCGMLVFSAKAENTNRSEEHTSELQSLRHLVCRLLLEKKKKKKTNQNLNHK